MKRNILLIFGIVFSLLIIPQTAEAHTVTDHGSESRGWVHNTHTIDGRVTSFYFHESTSPFFRDRLNYGRGYFRTETNGHLIAENRAQSYTDNYIAQHNSPGKSALAHVQSRVKGQHKMQWSLWFNQAYQSKYSASDWNRVAQHEIGHVYGLKDLSHSSNRNRLMYKSVIRNKGGLTANEKAGLGIIWRY